MGSKYVKPLKTIHGKVLTVQTENPSCATGVSLFAYTFLNYTFVYVKMTKPWI